MILTNRDLLSKGNYETISLDDFPPPPLETVGHHDNGTALEPPDEFRNGRGKPDAFSNIVDGLAPAHTRTSNPTRRLAPVEVA